MTLHINAEQKQQLLERFLRYVKIDTQSDENSSTSPSTEKQKDLSRLLAQELKDMGIDDAEMNKWGYITATIPANIPAGHPAAGKVPTIGFLAHVDTYFGTSGKNVNPQVIDSYDGADIKLNDDLTLHTDKNPNLLLCQGHTLIHTDGTTLLGADDKAGIAEIMSLAAWLKANPDFIHGPIRIGFTTDEEIGRGTENFDVKDFAADYAYTFDGSDLGEIEDETFCADSAIVTIEGQDVHPGYAKNKMVNAVRVAGAIIDLIDSRFLPETTEGRQSYLHPYVVSGDVAKTELKVLVRAFTNDELKEREDALRWVVSEVQTRFPNVKISVTIEESYRNMAYKINEDAKVLEYALEAVDRIGVTAKRQAIRGGTDGARLSFMGLLTPNIWAGGQNFHSVQEWVSLDWMSKAVDLGVELLKVWVEKSR